MSFGGGSKIKEAKSPFEDIKNFHNGMWGIGHGKTMRNDKKVSTTARLADDLTESIELARGGIRDNMRTYMQPLQQQAADLDKSPFFNYQQGLFNKGLETSRSALDNRMVGRGLTNSTTMGAYNAALNQDAALRNNALRSQTIDTINQQTANKIGLGNNFIGSMAGLMNMLSAPTGQNMMQSMQTNAQFDMLNAQNARQDEIARQQAFGSLLGTFGGPIGAGASQFIAGPYGAQAGSDSFGQILGAVMGAAGGMGGMGGMGGGGMSMPTPSSSGGSVFGGALNYPQSHTFAQSSSPFMGSYFNGY